MKIDESTVIITLVSLSLIVVYKRRKEAHFLKFWLVFSLTTALIMTSFFFSSAYGIALKDFDFSYWDGSFKMYWIDMEGNLVPKLTIKFWIVGLIITYCLFGVPLATIRALGLFPHNRFDKFLNLLLKKKFLFAPQIVLALIFISSAVSPSEYPIQSWIGMIATLIIGFKFFGFNTMKFAQNYFDADIISDLANVEKP